MRFSLLVPGRVPGSQGRYGGAFRRKQRAAMPFGHRPCRQRHGKGLVRVTLAHEQYGADAVGFGFAEFITGDSRQMPGAGQRLLGHSKIASLQLDLGTASHGKGQQGSVLLLLGVAHSFAGSTVGLHQVAHFAPGESEVVPGLRETTTVTEALVLQQGVPKQAERPMRVAAQIGHGREIVGRARTEDVIAQLLGQRHCLVEVALRLSQCPPLPGNGSEQVDGSHPAIPVATDMELGERLGRVTLAHVQFAPPCMPRGGTKQDRRVGGRRLRPHGVPQ